MNPKKAKKKAKLIRDVVMKEIACRSGFKSLIDECAKEGTINSLRKELKQAIFYALSVGVFTSVDYYQPTDKEELQKIIAFGVGKSSYIYCHTCKEVRSCWVLGNYSDLKNKTVCAHCTYDPFLKPPTGTREDERLEE